MASTLVFDVNETLLDLCALDPHFKRLFGDKKVKNEWFKQVLQTALVMTILGRYTDFGNVGQIALDMTALRHNIELTDNDRQAIADTMLSLPPHPEVHQAIQLLSDANIRLAALTNSSQKAAETQLTNAGLDHFFDKIMSVEAVRKFKPSIEVYQMAQEELGESLDNLWLVAAHDWDIAGAMNAGWRGLFVTRPGMVFAPQATQPQIIGQDIVSAVQQWRNQYT